jgi:hypothetical protein
MEALRRSVEWNSLALSTKLTMEEMNASEDEHQLKLIDFISSVVCVVRWQKGINGGGQAITWASPTNSLKSNKPTQDDDAQDDPDVIPSYHQYGNNK